MKQIIFVAIYAMPVRQDL